MAHVYTELFERLRKGLEEGHGAGRCVLWDSVRERRGRQDVMVNRMQDHG